MNPRQLIAEIRVIALLAMAAVLTNCEKPQTNIVVFDGWWAADFAKEACEQARGWWEKNGDAVTQLGCEYVSGCAEMQPVYLACVSDPVREVRHFEATLRTEFGSLANCQGIEFIVLIDPAKADKDVNAAMTKPHWDLIVDYVPGKQKQSWWLKRQDSSAAAEGEGSAMEIAAKVCPIVNQLGARLE